jgi:hypothetical protein
MTSRDHHHQRRRISAGALALGAFAGVALGACGDDEEAAAVCAPYLQTSAAFNGEPDPAQVTPLLDQLDEDAPDEIADEVAVMSGAARQALEGDTSALESPEFVQAMGEVDPWMFENCEFDATSEVTATEYEFEGLKDEYDAGRVGLLLTNDGAEAHEMAIMKKADGVTDSWDDILALPQDEAESKVEQVGSTFAPRKGTSGLAVVDLEEGEYIALCFVPMGTSMAADGSFTEGEGQPHFMGGMKHEFTVDA